jgi:micrococcal nuclease
LDEDDLLRARRDLERLYLAAATPTLRIRIDAALALVEERLAQAANARFCRRLAALAGRLQSRAALAQALRAPPRATGEGVSWARVARVVDGDTIVLADGERVRYIGMDTPELNNGVGKSGRAEPWAHRAAAANAAWVAGKTVCLLAERSNRDRYGRLLRHVFCDGVFVGAQLALDGYARLYTLPPDTRYAELLARCEAAARRHRLGLWSQPGWHEA